MSFLVRGVEMPESCAMCPNFMISLDESQQYFCGYTYEEIDRSAAIGKPEWCPLEEEPERKRGKWIWDDEGYHCSECFYHAYWNTLEVMDGTYRFCPNCGADMRGKS